MTILSGLPLPGDEIVAMLADVRPVSEDEDHPNPLYVSWRSGPPTRPSLGGAHQVPVGGRVRSPNEASGE